MRRTAIAEWLEQHGLMLCAFHLPTVPEDISAAVLGSLADDELAEKNRESSLLLLANAGPKFWHSLKTLDITGTCDPVDAASVILAKRFNMQFLSDPKTDTNTPLLQLYPTPLTQSPIPLMRLGGLAGWNVPSPLGLGLHPEFGPWSAYRAAWLSTSQQLPVAYYIQSDAQKSQPIGNLQHSAWLCTECSAPCETACPAQAVQKHENFNVQRCYDYRLPNHSDCHTNCFARRACPIGVEHQYDTEQLTHHMSMTWR